MVHFCPACRRPARLHPPRFPHKNISLFVFAQRAAAGRGRDRRVFRTENMNFMFMFIQVLKYSSIRFRPALAQRAAAARGLSHSVFCTKNINFMFMFYSSIQVFIFAFSGVILVLSQKKHKHKSN